ncbi:MAG: carbon starvation protein A [Candidatus Sumerlaeota bacterium]|nr:carbon starvation protein A [Candidatus Sumerlaeota bacterium]
MNALTLLVVALCVFALAYRYYGLFIASKVLRIRKDRPTPAITLADGHDYVKTNRYVLFGHHFAAIAAAGPLLGPVLAAQFGYLPGALWIIIGSVLAGAVHDMVVLFVSVRHNGQGIAHIAAKEIGRVAGATASIAVLFILILTLAGLSLAVVNAMANSVWGTFMVFATIPIALIMGAYLHVWRKGDVLGASIIGVALLFIALLAGPYVADTPSLARYFQYSNNTISVIIPIYGFIASVLPVWLLLCPRDYLSTYLKIGTVVALAAGICFVRPDFLMPAVTSFVHGGGPIIPGSVFPFIFITIACGALSGFHTIIGTGTTPKMIASEGDVLFIGYGAMLVEGIVAIMALTAACVLVPADYFAINASPEAFAKLGMTPVNLDFLSREVGEKLQGRPGGAVSLAVGMAYIFSSFPFMERLMSYWYHFAIMFEAVFVLTAVDTGTRVGRYMLQEAVGSVVPKFLERKWMPGILITSFVFTFAWGYLVYTGDISTIWPLFGMSNQMLASYGLILGTTILLRTGRMCYALITGAPGLFMALITMQAGYLNIVTNYWPKGRLLLVVLSIAIMALMLIVIILTLMRWFTIIRKKLYINREYGDNANGAPA